MRFALHALACLLIPATMFGQQTGRQAGDSLLAEMHFAPDSSDSLIVPMRKQAVYRIEATGITAAPVVMSSGKRPETPFIETIPVPKLSLADAAFEVYPTSDGNYVLRPAAQDRSRAVAFTVYGDAAETTDRVERINRKHVRAGLELDVSVHTAYHLPFDTATGRGGGVSYEGCLLISGGGPLSGCAGFESEQRKGASSIIWAFFEPRYLLLRSASTGDLGVSFRFSRGNVSGESDTPALLGVGAFYQHYIWETPRGTGAALRLNLSYRLTWNSGPSSPTIRNRADVERVGVGIWVIP